MRVLSARLLPFAFAPLALALAFLLAACEAGPVGLDEVSVRRTAGDGRDTSGSERLCLTLSAPGPITLDQVRFLSATWTGPIEVGVEPIDLCAMGCWCFAPSGNLATLVKGGEQREVDLGSGACCG